MNYTPMQSEWVAALVFFIIVVIAAVVLGVQLICRLRRISALEEKVALDASQFISAHVTKWFRDLGRLPIEEVDITMREYVQKVFSKLDTDIELRTPEVKTHYDDGHIVVTIRVGNFYKHDYYADYVFESPAPEACCMVAHI